jgi:hypothetical protein
MQVGKLNATTAESYIDLNVRNATLILSPLDGDAEIAINDNSAANYQTYRALEVFPISENNSLISRVYYKTTSGTATIRFWLLG